MIPSRDSHLEPSELESFLISQLTPEDEQSFIQHLDSCVDCRKTLESAAGSQEWWYDAKESLTGERLIQSDDAQRAAGGVASERLEQQLSHILVRSDDPRMIGRIGNYQIAGVIGRGGTGIVLKGFDASLDRFVAVKVLASELSIMGAARERFQREAQAAAAVTHENVVPIHAVSEFQGHSYIVMQYVPGHSLEQRIRQGGPLEIVEVLRIAMQIARALGAAHEQGVVHRDIKPANILLEEGIDRPIVTDFGLARVANDASLTRSGAVAGTPNYMSPEQSSGSQVDARSDLFSLGSVMYAMCVGHPPFRAETLVGVLRRVCDHEPNSLREQNPRMPEWIEPFIFKLLAKDPDDRFHSAVEVAELLSEELSHCQSPTLHGPPPRHWWSRPRSRLARKPAILLLGAFTVLIAVAGTWVVYHRPGETKPPPQEVVEPSNPLGNIISTAPAPDALSWDTTLSETAQASKQLETA